MALIDEGNTIPFIARYRKEMHGSMDDTALRALEERLQYLRNLEKRREEVKSSIEGQGKLTDELRAAILAAATLAEAEDLYQLGCVGFLKAVEGFDLEYGTQFSTYAVPKISGEIRRFLRDDGVIKISVYIETVENVAIRG